jgi:hypothetical protein
MGCMGLGGIRSFLPIDKNFPNWELEGVAGTLGWSDGGRFARLKDPHLENREMWGTRNLNQWNSTVMNLASCLPVLVRVWV